MKQHTLLFCFVFAPGAALLTAVHAGSANADGLEQIRVCEGHADKVTCVAVSSDGERILSASDDSTVREWDLRSGRQIAVWRDHNECALCVAYSSDGTLAASGGGGVLDSQGRFRNGDDHVLRLYHAETGDVVRRMVGHTAPIWCVAFSPDNRQLVSGSGGWIIEEGEFVLRNQRPIPFGFDLILWDVKTGKKVRAFDGHQNWVRGIAFTPGGESIVSASWDNSIRLWDVATGEERRRLRGHDARINSVDISPDGKWIVSGDSDGTIIVWEFATGKEVRRLDGHSERVWSVSFSSNGRWIASGSTDRTARIWDAATGEQLGQFSGHSDLLRDVEFTPDDRHLVTASHDKTVRLLRVLPTSE